MSNNNTSSDNLNIINDNIKQLSNSMNENFKNVFSLFGKRKRDVKTDENETIRGANSDDSNINGSKVGGRGRGRGRGRGHGRGRGINKNQQATTRKSKRTRNN